MPERIVEEKEKKRRKRKHTGDRPFREHRSNIHSRRTTVAAVANRIAGPFPI